MKRLQAHLAYALARAGWAGAVGVALLAFALAIHFGAAAPLQAELESLEAEHESLAERVAQGVKVRVVRGMITEVRAKGEPVKENA